ncbi:hypothetical protein [Paraferrimonas sedimenticola]|uniref:Uncharacterized protein n=1 Tax=Paraferrimonas sedimenticola TaxID=375674 RepID=A0AA37RW56_9GAMM|nr:hypothetical protein [Paraferrimonas sedimenticola]GLP96465.1 hypothetical protein GCM10007895_17710 [Paraferrimonas sedimenticola]
MQMGTQLLANGKTEPSVVIPNFRIVIPNFRVVIPNFRVVIPNSIGNLPSCYWRLARLPPSRQ